MKRKASNGSFELFVRTSWEKNSETGDYNDFKKTCEIKWLEMTDQEKEEYKEDNPKPKKRSRKMAKKEKDPYKPKKPLTSYLLFCEAFREKVKISNPGMSMTGIVKELSARWKDLTPHDKQKYIDLANDEKKKYLELLNERAGKVE